MVAFRHLPLLLSAVYLDKSIQIVSAVASSSNGRFLRGQSDLNDIFDIALRTHGTVSSLTVPPWHRKTRADDPVVAYAQQCSSFLTSQEVIADGIISQDEFADFMISQCRVEGICTGNTKIKFDQLDLNVQLKFIAGICSKEDFMEKSNCIYDLRVMWIESGIFGLRTDGEIVNVQSIIHAMCTEVYYDAVKMGFTRTSEPTPTPSASKIPSSVPTMKPSASSIPSSSHPTVELTLEPSMPTVTFVVRTSSVPTNEPSSTAPSQADISTSSSLPSVWNEPTNDFSNPPMDNENADSFDRDTIIVAAVTLTLIIVASLYKTSNRPPRIVTTTKQTLSTAPENSQWDTIIPSVPDIGLGSTQSMSSSSSSISRDGRFINVYSSQGSPIPQFNPSTASAVVIGTVSIGSSSYSSDFLRSGSDYQTSNFVSPSFSSNSYHSVKTRLSPRSMKSFKRMMSLSHGYKHSFSSSPRSCKTMPITCANFNCNASSIDAGDIDENGFFLDLEMATSHSLPVISRTISFASSTSDAGGASSMLCESLDHCITLSFSCLLSPSNPTTADSFFTAAFTHVQNQSMATALQLSASDASNVDDTPSHVLVPWRKGGFSGEMEFSDENGSESYSESSVSCSALPIRRKRRLLGPSKRLFAVLKKKTKAKFSLRRKQYQHLQGIELHEDPSVLSMSNSYLSGDNLISLQQKTTPDKLGTFAAATQPLKQVSGPSLWLGKGHSLETCSASNQISNFELEAIQTPPSQTELRRREDSCHCPSSSSSVSDESIKGGQWLDIKDCNFEEASEVNCGKSDIQVEGSIDLSQMDSRCNLCESLMVSDSSMTSSGEDHSCKGSSNSFIDVAKNLCKESLVLSYSNDDSGYNTPQSPNVVSDPSQEMLFSSDESSPFVELKSSSIDPNRHDRNLSLDECAANVIAWAIENETKKLECEISL